jgi:hypothetical protein
MTPNQAGNILVFDTEGVDSMARGDEREVSEMTCADFCRKWSE